MGSFGAIDLFSGSGAISGTNLFQIDKNPLNQLDGGTQDIVGKQGASTGDMIMESLQRLVDAILGIDPNSPLGGVISDVFTFFDNILDFLGGLNPLDPNFDPLGSIVNFIIEMLLPALNPSTGMNLLAGLVPFDQLGQGSPLKGFIPLENLAIDLIVGGVESVQALIDAFLKTFLPGYVPGTGVVADIFNFFTDFLQMFTNMDLSDPNWYLSFGSGSFDPLAALEHLVADMLNPTNYFGNLLAMLGLPDFTLPTFDPLTAVETFIHDMLNPSDYFTNLLKMLGLPDFTLPTFDPQAAILDFIQDMLHPTDLLCPLVPFGSIDIQNPLGNYVPMQHLALDAISAEVGKVIGTMQEIIDAILASLSGILPGFGTGDLSDITRYFNDLIKMLGQPPLTTGAQLPPFQIPCFNITGLWNGDSIADSAQALADATVGGIVNALPGVPQNPTDMRNVLADMAHNFLGFIDTRFWPAGTQPPPRSIGSITMSNDAHLQNVSANRPVSAGVDQSADPVFDFSTLTGSTTPTVPVVPGSSVIGMIGTPNIANKKSIEFYGGNTAGLTGLYINLYQVNPTPKNQGGTGVTTWLHSSSNIVSALRDLKGTEKDSIEERVSSGMAWNYYNFPSGSIQTVSLGLPAQLPGAGTFQLTFKNYPTYAIGYNADRATVQTALARLTSIGTNNVYVYGPPGGPWTVCFRGTLAYTTQPLMTITPALPPGALPKVYDGLVTGQGNYYAVELMVTGSGQYDIAGTIHAALPHINAHPQHFGAKRATSTQPPPATIVPNYNTPAVPWFGLCGEPGETQYTPTLITLSASGTFDPSKYLWANYFDAVVCGGGGGGCAGALLNGAWGGQGGKWAAKRVTRAGLAAGVWNFSRGAGGLGGKVTGTTGQAGSPSAIAIPGQSTLSANGGPGGYAATGNVNFGAGAGPGDYTFNDAYGNPHIYLGGPGGAVANGNGGQPGGGGAGGNATAQLHDQFGGDGGPGGGYILAYQ